MAAKKEASLSEEIKEDSFTLEKQDKSISDLNKRILDYTDKRLADLEKNKNDVLTEGECRTLTFMLKVINDMTENIKTRINIREGI